MIAEKPSHIAVTGNITGQDIAMGMAADASQHLIGVLTRLYSNPRAAVIREYAANALDSHIAAGINRPIEVKTPTSLDPTFSVKDFGVGLSLDDVIKVYSQYGASTKRDSNDQVGSFGLGSKSALAYTTSFTVVSVKGGVRITLAVSLNDDGMPTMKVVDNRPTSEANGVEVIIPTHDQYEFEREAAAFFRFWKPGTVLVNGSQPRHAESVVTLSDDAWVIQGYGEDTVVMGNVPYPAPRKLNVGLSYGYSVVHRIPIGSAQPVPSRDALEQTKRTMATMDRIEAEVIDLLKDKVQEDVDAQPTHREALASLRTWRRVLGNMPTISTYRGGAIPTTIDVATPGHKFHVVPLNGRKMADCRPVDKLDVNLAADSVWVEGYDRLTFTAGQRKKLDHFCDEQGIDVSSGWVLTGSRKPASPWLKQATVIQWSDVAAVKLPRAQRTSGGRLAGSYDVYIGGSLKYEVAADDIETDEGLFFYEGSIHECGHFVRRITQSYPDCSVVVFSANRTAKFRRNFPEAMPVERGLRDLAQAWADGLTTKQKVGLAMSQDGQTSTLRKLDADRIEDPVLADLVRIAKRDTGKIEKALDEWRYHIPPADLKLPTIAQRLDRYPLYLNALSGYGRNRMGDDIYLYINAKHAALEAEAAAKAEQAEAALAEAVAA